MPTDDKEAAYLDVMKRLKGSMLGPQLAVPIEDYVHHLASENIKLHDAIMAASMSLASGDFLETIKVLNKAPDPSYTYVSTEYTKPLDNKSNQG